MAQNLTDRNAQKMDMHHAAWPNSSDCKMIDPF